jgi:hypothetical protein
MAQANTQGLAFDLIADLPAIAPTRKFHEHSPQPLGDSTDAAIRCSEPA